MTRFVPVTVLVMLLATSGVADAQMGSGSAFPNASATIVFEKREIFHDDPTTPFFQPQAASSDLFHYFNLAHCNCAQPHAGLDIVQSTTNHIGNFRYLVRLTAQSGLTSSSPVDYWAGTNCTDDATRNGTATTCEKIGTTPDIDTNLLRSGDTQEFNLYQVVNAKNNAAACFQSNSVSAPIYAFVPFPGSQANTYNYEISQNAGLLSTDTGTAAGVDTQPPPLPTNIVAQPDEGAIDLSWTPPASNNTDVAYYQALCALDEDNFPPALASPSDSPQYVTTAATCPGVSIPADLTASEVPTQTALDNGEAAVPQPAGAFAALDAKYICGQQSGATASSLTIKHLENGTAYRVILVAIDLHGNFSATYFDHTITPHLVTDFWEDLHNQGSNANGGLCLLAETYGDDSALTRMLRAFRDDTLGGSRAGRWLGEAYYATLGRLGGYVHGSAALRAIAAVVLAPAVAFALLWHWLTLPGALGLLAAAWWYRRRRRAAAVSGRAWSRLHAAGVAGAALVTLGAAQAHAGNGYQPYWENSDLADQSKEEVSPGDPSLVAWHAGIRIGPYVPDIDDQVGKHPGPYEEMFGGYHMLPMLDVDRILWTGFGQVGIGVSAGYWQKTARAFTMNSDPSDPNRPREPGAKTAFRLIPLELSATYRFTVLDDAYDIPVVPYVRGGLAYYIWWMTAPNGNYSRICDVNNENCGNKALGASAGVQGAIGLAIRAEKIDSSAAMSMQNSGIQHAGIYGELSVAKVDGFGSDTKLSVGSTTWFAGVDFEF